MGLEKMRKESGMKAYKIAEMLGISRVQFRNLERGDYKISDDKIEKLSKLYEKPIDEIKEVIKEGEHDRKRERI